MHTYTHPVYTLYILYTHHQYIERITPFFISMIHTHMYWQLDNSLVFSLKHNISRLNQIKTFAVE